MNKHHFIILILSFLLLAPVYAQQAGSSAAAKSNQCIGCHNIDGLRSVYPEVFPIPRIIGQSASYIEYALKAYRANERYHPSMNGIAATLTDDEIKQLAEFYANSKK